MTTIDTCDLASVAGGVDCESLKIPPMPKPNAPAAEFDKVASALDARVACFQDDAKTARNNYEVIRAATH
jgi:hypothetical protein